MLKPIIVMYPSSPPATRMNALPSAPSVLSCYLISNVSQHINGLPFLLVTGAKVWVTLRFFLAPIRWRGFFARCAATVLPFRTEPGRA